MVDRNPCGKRTTTLSRCMKIFRSIKVTTWDSIRVSERRTEKSILTRSEPMPTYGRRMISNPIRTIWRMTNAANRPYSCSLTRMHTSRRFLTMRIRAYRIKTRSTNCLVFCGAQSTRSAGFRYKTVVSKTSGTSCNDTFKKNALRKEGRISALNWLANNKCDKLVYDYMTSLEVKNFAF